MIERIQQAHALYCRLTGQRVSLRFDRERLWYELFQAGFNEVDLQRVIAYLQREIRAKSACGDPGEVGLRPRKPVW